MHPCICVYIAHYSASRPKVLCLRKLLAQALAQIVVRVACASCLRELLARHPLRKVFVQARRELRVGSQAHMHARWRNNVYTSMLACVRMYVRGHLHRVVDIRMICLRELCASPAQPSKLLLRVACVRCLRTLLREVLAHILCASKFHCATRLRESLREVGFIC